MPSMVIGLAHLVFKQLIDSGPQLIRRLIKLVTTIVVGKRLASKERGFLVSHELPLRTVPEEETPRCAELWQPGCSKNVEHLQSF